MILETYKVYTDPTGRKHIAQAIDEMDKNHKEDSTEVANAAKMYKTLGKNIPKQSNKWTETNKTKQTKKKQT